MENLAPYSADRARYLEKGEPEPLILEQKWDDLTPWQDKAGWYLSNRELPAERGAAWRSGLPPEQAARVALREDGGRINGNCGWERTGGERFPALRRTSLAAARASGGSLQLGSLRDADVKHARLAEKIHVELHDEIDLPEQDRHRIGSRPGEHQTHRRQVADHAVEQQRPGFVTAKISGEPEWRVLLFPGRAQFKSDSPRQNIEGGT